VKRDPRGVRLITSDAHEGLKQAIATVLSGATVAAMPIYAESPHDGAQRRAGSDRGVVRTISGYHPNARSHECHEPSAAARASVLHAAARRPGPPPAHGEQRLSAAQAVAWCPGSQRVIQAKPVSGRSADMTGFEPSINGRI
jgi:hypothetical protein